MWKPKKWLNIMDGSGRKKGRRDVESSRSALEFVCIGEISRLALSK
jgi:hypothetical protein